MSQRYTPDGDAVERSDGSVGFPMIYRDSDGRVVSTAFIPDGHEPDVPDVVDIDQSDVVEWQTVQETRRHEIYRDDTF